MPLPRVIFVLDLEELKNAINSNTKALIINTPHNPTGKVFSISELSSIAQVVQNNSRRMIVIVDEVYEWIIYDGNPMARMCKVPGMWERTINVSSAAKTFSVTGWKIGWVYGPANLISAVARCHQFAAFSVTTPLQEALAVSLEMIIDTTPSPFLRELKENYAKKGEFLRKTLLEIGLKPLAPQGTYYTVVDITDFKMEKEWGTLPAMSITGLYFDRKDWNFCRWLVDNGVAAIPCSAFYMDSDDGSVPTNMVRFAFCKTDEELEKARTVLLSLKKYFHQ